MRVFFNMWQNVTFRILWPRLAKNDHYDFVHASLIITIHTSLNILELLQPAATTWNYFVIMRSTIRRSEQFWKCVQLFWSNRVSSNLGRSDSLYSFWSWTLALEMSQLWMILQLFCFLCLLFFKGFATVPRSAKCRPARQVFRYRNCKFIRQSCN